MFENISKKNQLKEIIKKKNDKMQPIFFYLFVLFYYTSKIYWLKKKHLQVHGLCTKKGMKIK